MVLLSTPGEGTPYIMAYTGGSAQKWYLFRLHVYESLGISLVEVYERVGKSVILVCKMTQTGYRRILWLCKNRENVLFY